MKNKQTLENSIHCGDNCERRIEKIINIDSRLRTIRLLSRILAAIIALGGVGTIAKGIGANNENISAAGIGFVMFSMVVMLCGHDTSEKIERINNIYDELRKRIARDIQRG